MDTSHSGVGGSEPFFENRPQTIIQQFRGLDVIPWNMLNPVNGTYYVVLPTVSDVYLYFVKGQFTVNNEAWDMRITIDGVVYLGGPVGGWNSWDFITRGISGDIAVNTLESWDEGLNGPVMFMYSQGLYCESLQVEVRPVVPVTAGNTLQVRTIIGQL